MKPAPFEFARAADLAEAIRLLDSADGEARPYAGGQSLGPMLNLRLARPGLLVDLSGVGELRGAEDDGDGLSVGAATVHADFEDGRVPDVANGLLRHAASGIAYRAVRNRGTIGGSLAHADPAADWPPVMIALGASLRISGSGGEREVAADGLATGNLTTVLGRDEIIRSIRVPRLSPDARWGHYKVCVKPGDFAESLAVVVDDPARGFRRAVVAGPSSPPVRVAAVEEILAEGVDPAAASGERVRAETTRALVAAGFVGEDDRYAVRLHGAVLARAVEQAVSA